MASRWTWLTTSGTRRLPQLGFPSQGRRRGLQHADWNVGRLSAEDLRVCQHDARPSGARVLPSNAGTPLDHANVEKGFNGHSPDGRSPSPSPNSDTALPTSKARGFCPLGEGELGCDAPSWLQI